MLILTLLIPDTKGNGTGTCKYIRLIRSDILVPYDDHLTMVYHDKNPFVKLSLSFNLPHAFHPSPLGEVGMALNVIHSHWNWMSSGARYPLYSYCCVMHLMKGEESQMLEISSLHLQPHPIPSLLNHPSL